ncbi:DUF523 and DUF1722 domain-containing protein [Romboutsia sedimentorum]|uniref:DUF523 and DUF1722 domain-containing protein n=1 Tax=Romboutsia sedimentorum TaxID=1368474 RepID=A0ABT7E8T0_9FIRM|nr:DUF523 and DUF1722 domain-containing protein [Romboutsia sedimentorum]MDK2563328.1 DUF523 and DUF1722 domain-containing protein [Romboutsia sedimentorum]MDK2585052.1 DUF523 and DUF1722 domain-containing protein [Romboutsia sedimentorum]
MRKPKLIISRCLNSEKCRYDGQGFEDKVIANLKEYIDIETVCPEVSIGLSTPRDPIRIEKHGEEYKLIQRNSEFDCTTHMNEFAEEFLSEIKDIDGFILKSKSPSCGIKDVKIYPKGNKYSISKKGRGLFSEKIINGYSNVPIEDEGRLKNYNIRDEFLTKIFAINNLKCSENIFEYHNENYMLLKSYNEKATKDLDYIIKSNKLNKETISVYKNKVQEILNAKRQENNKIKVVKEIFDKYKNDLTINEVENYEKLLQSYKDKKIPYSALLVATKIYCIRFDDEVAINQTFFNPYPEKLINISDSGKGRDL